MEPVTSLLRIPIAESIAIRLVSASVIDRNLAFVSHDIQGKRPAGKLDRFPLPIRACPPGTPVRFIPILISDKTRHSPGAGHTLAHIACACHNGHS